jgi:hypothetical protein
MKNLINRITIAALILSFGGACSIQKRQHLPGFYVQKNRVSSSVSTSKNTTDKQIVTELEKSSFIADKEMQNILIQQNSEQKTNLLLKEEKIELRAKNDRNNTPNLKDLHIESKKSVQVKPGINLLSSSIEKVTTKKKMENSNDSDNGNNALRGVGWFFIIIGIVLVLLVSILIGILLMLLGLLFVVAGRNKPTKERETSLQDVVYLKNGSVIRGTIIEQIPNVSLKIRTNDQNVFFFKMEEIEKITKE